ncbi:MAG: hypothetical protein JNM18_23880, partial [Planctomycetaceae bacterium]|nr:hypothetical protein [Planctomycetaceae bacterium]
VKRQAADGSLGVSATQDAPHWPTGIAVLAWALAPRYSPYSAATHPFREPIVNALKWIFSLKGKPAPQSPELGHDTTLVGWPWVESTHTWLEPTALYLLALKATGQHAHTRAREAVKVLLDRQIPCGGCNYGNTFVLGQELRPHVEPSGLALWALGNVPDPTGKLAKSIDFVVRQTSAETSTVSLAYALFGLATQQRFPAQAQEWLAQALARSEKRERSAYRLALVALAALGEKCPMIQLAQEESAS